MHDASVETDFSFNSYNKDDLILIIHCLKCILMVL